MSHPFTEEEIAVLSDEIDRQLRELQASPRPEVYKQASRGLPELPEAQQRRIAEATGENARTFLDKFKAAARKDLCQEGGVLYAQWKKWGDLSNEKVLRTFGSILVAMGFSGNVLQTLAVALAVIVIHIGIKALCEEDDA